MYKALEGFIDRVEKKSYRKGDEVVFTDKSDKKRISSLLSEDNHQGRVMIEELKKDIKKKGE